MGFGMYSQDHSNYYPAICDDTSYSGRYKWPGQWFMQLCPYMGYKWSPGVRPSKFTYTMFVCPSAVAGENAQDMGNNVQLGIGMSRFIPPVSDSLPDYGTKLRTYPNTLLVDSPATKLLIADAKKFCLEGYWEFTQSPPACYEFYFVRHSLGAVTGYCDGHAAWMSHNEIREKGVAQTLY